MKRLLFVITSFIFCLSACNKTGNSVVEQTNEVKAEESKTSKEVADNTEKPKSRPRIRELDWYVGKWKEIENSEHDSFDKKSKISIELEISKKNNKYFITMHENGKKTEGELYIDKYFLPKNLPEEEKENYDSRDFVVADFSTIRYWIGIRYTGEEDENISLNLDDIDLCVCKRISKGNEGKENLLYQNTDPMRSDYKESDSDGYSWRNRDCTYDKNDRVLTKEKLLSTSWSMDSEVNQYYKLCFYTDDVFKAGTRQAGVNCIGTYEVRDGKVFMKTTQQGDIGIEQYFPASEEEYYGDFHPYSDSVIFSHELVINGYRFFPGNCYKEDGESALVQDIPLVVESKKAIVTDNVKLRSGPGTNYKQLDCYLTINLIADGYPNSRIERPAPLLKYSDFHTLGHTLKKDKIGDDEAYWYYIVYSDGFESSFNAWIYGAWIEDFDESLSDDYWKKWWKLAKEKYNLKQYDEP